MSPDDARRMVRNLAQAAHITEAEAAARIRQAQDAAEAATWPAGDVPLPADLATVDPVDGARMLTGAIEELGAMVAAQVEARCRGGGGRALPRASYTIDHHSGKRVRLDAMTAVHLKAATACFMETAASAVAEAVLLRVLAQRQWAILSRGRPLGDVE